MASERTFRPEQAEAPTAAEQLLALPPAERILQLCIWLQSQIAAAPGVAEAEISLDASFAQLNETWVDPSEVYAFIGDSVQELIARPLYIWEFMRWAHGVEPIGSIRELAEHLYRELVIPAPEAPYADPRECGIWSWDLPAARPSGLPRNRPMVFLLGGPRSGSTLLRVMLARHPDLFCGPELHLLPFERMAQRDRMITQAGYPWMKSGLVQTLAALEGSAPEQAEEQVHQLIEDDVSIQDVYRLLQGQIGERLLVDKSPSSTFHPAYLARAEDLFEDPKYLYLARHPYATIESFVRMRFHWLIGNQFPVWDVNPWLFAEKCWAENNRNAIRFLGGIAGERQHWLCYEDLVADPEATMTSICDFLGIPFDDALLDPYGDNRASAGLGDPNLLNYRGIDASLATAWKKNPPPSN